MNRAIIHLNVADFAAAVEILAQPGIKDFPVVIAPVGAPRAVVYDMNDTAFQQGICKGMPLSLARQQCRDITILPPRFNRYEQVMTHILHQGLALTPAVESGVRDGHFFLDITGTRRLHGPPADVAHTLKKRIQKHIGVEPIWSVATSKLVAKVATRLVKPKGEYIVNPGDEADFLAPVPLHLMPGLAPDEMQKLSAFNLTTTSQLRELTPDQLQMLFSYRAGAIHDLVRGKDADPVVFDRTDAICAGHECSTDTNDAGVLQTIVCALAGKIGARLRHRGMAARTLCIDLSYSDGIQGRACRKMPTPTASDMVLCKTAVQLLARAQTRRVRIRHLSLVCKKPVPAMTQLFLFGESAREQKQLTVLAAMDRIRKRFGAGTVQPASTLHPACRYSAGSQP